MTFGFSDEQGALRAAVRGFLRAVSPESTVRRVMETPSGYDQETWDRMAAELGLQGLIVPERYGGSGGGAVELAIVLEELGRALYPGPLLSTALAAQAIMASGDARAQDELLPGIASGTTIATLAVAEPGGRWDAQGVACTASHAGGQWSLHGTKHYVTDGCAADLLVVAALAAGGVAMFLVRARAPGLARTPLTGFDLTRRLARIELRDVQAELLGEVSDGPALLSRILDLARVGVSAEQVGGAQAVLDMAVAYAKDRVQFGRAIGSFQAIKHLCADALLDVESARSAAFYGAWAAAEDSAELPTVAPLAKAYCSDAFVATAALNIQVHGGLAFTWEHPAHLYYRRARSSAQLWGGPSYHRDVLATRLGL